MMTSFTPRIGEVDVYSIKVIVRNHVTYYFNGIVANDADVFSSCLINAFSDGADTSNEHFTADEVYFWMNLSDGDCSFSHTTANFQHCRGLTAKNIGRVQNALSVFNLIFRQRFFNSTLLCRRDMSTAHYKRADVAIFEHL